MKKIYKVGYEYFSDLISAEIYSRKYYAGNKGYIQTISVDNIDVEKPVVIYVQWSINIDDYILYNYRIYKENEYLKRQYSGLRLNTVKVSFLKDIYCTAFGKFEFPTLKHAYKCIRGYYNKIIAKEVKESLSLKDSIEFEETLYLKI